MFSRATFFDTRPAKARRVRAASLHGLTSLALLVGSLTLGFSFATDAEARAQRGECSVYRGNNRIESNSCLAREICYFNERTRGETCRTEYLWPTNATTLVTYEGGVPRLVNGAPAQPRNIMGRRCALNTVSGNTFCYRGR